jgi:hypothetical protein
MTMKPTESSERIKALTRQHTASMAAAPMPASTPATASRPPPVATIATANPPTRPATVPETPNVRWDRITIRLTAGELEKINDVVIATQQANRSGRVTTTDILRVALRRVKDQEAIDAREIKALRARDGRFARDRKV